MYYVYLLKSESDTHFYIGYSSDLKRRLFEHHQGKVYYTRRYRPWRLVYYEAYLDEVQAKRRERMLKQYGSAYKLLLKRIGLNK
ncbi:MAG: GIY-YIG nuclease family protein [Parcubacteria group bacterium]|nr:GIY-YIG nuclease family protein [Parcubacteria group bacterium]